MPQTPLLGFAVYTLAAMALLFLAMRRGGLAKSRVWSAGTAIVRGEHGGFERGIAWCALAGVVAGVALIVVGLLG